jgi:hypothetical protein
MATTTRIQPPRPALTTALVVATAAAIADREGAAAVMLTRVSEELGCHVTSLRHSMPTLDALHREIALLAIRSLGEKLRSASPARPPSAP